MSKLRQGCRACWISTKTFVHCPSAAVPPRYRDLPLSNLIQTGHSHLFDLYVVAIATDTVTNPSSSCEHRSATL
jgi:hypothetical protein